MELSKFEMKVKEMYKNYRGIDFYRKDYFSDMIGVSKYYSILTSVNLLNMKEEQAAYINLETLCQTIRMNG